MRVFKLAVAAAVAVMAPAAAIGINGSRNAPPAAVSAETIAIGPTAIDYPLPGEFLADGRPTAAPIEEVRTGPFRIMARQVSLTDYGLCVADGDCQPPDAKATGEDIPVTGVNYLDAEAFARWYSRVTGERWRLPTAVEVAVAAAERFGGETFSGASDDPGNPSVRWLRRYREEAAAKRPADPLPKRRGHYGKNSLGLGDFAGNVWEWTSTCYVRVVIEPATGKIASTTENCGVRVLEGRHRAYMTDFVRDGRSGGCAVGTPPENLGFRLVRDETSYLARAGSWIRKTARSALGGSA